VCTARKTLADHKLRSKEQKKELNTLDEADFVRNVEKVDFPEKSRKSGDRKCLGDWEKPFAELSDAKQFLQFRGKRVFQHPLLLSPPISK
jgi:hypothetical protein